MGESFFEDFQKMWGVFYPKSGVFSGFWVVFWVGVFGLWVGVLGPWFSGHTVSKFGQLIFEFDALLSSLEF